MSKILELRTKRNTLWEQTKDFLEKNRGENGLVKAEAVEQYNKMAQEVKDLGAEIERLEQQAQIEAQLSAPTSSPVHADPKNGAKKDVKPTATAEYAENFWNMIRNRGHYGEVRNALSVGEDTEGGFTVPDEFEKKLVEALEENNIFRGLATVIRTSSGTRKIPIAEDTGEASWIDEGEEIPESDTTFGQTMLSAYKLGTMIKISNELLNDSAFDLATYIARRFGVRMGNAEERAFITGDGVGKPLGLLAETGGAKVGVTAAQKDAVTFDEIKNLVGDELVASAIKSAMAELGPNEVTNRTKIEPLAQQKLAESLVQKYGDDVVFVNKVVINDMNFEDAYNEAIQQKSIAQQNADKQKIENEAAIAKAEADKQVAITNAEAEAQKTSIAAEAQAEANRKLAESLCDTLIEYQKIQKWDGKLPTVSGGNALVSIDPAE